MGWWGRQRGVAAVETRARAPRNHHSLPPSPFQPIADALANAPDDASVAAQAAALFAAAPAGALPPVVWIAHDTRPSSPALAAATAAGVVAAGGVVVGAGVATTPQLHWLVAAAARGEGATPAAYFHALASGHATLVAGTDPVNGEGTPLIVDCANGVGAAAVASLAPLVSAAGLSLTPVNIATDDPAALNAGAGSDHVQRTRTRPTNCASIPPGALCASLDGDADRVLYWTPHGEGDGVTVFDGDRIAALLARWAARVLLPALPNPPDASGPLTLGQVRTAYANGAAVEAAVAALGERGVPVARTGVKHLHAAATAFDVGVYYEANGHGALLLGPRFKAAADAAAAAGDARAASQAAALASASNQAVGDALSGLLLVDAALRGLGWSVAAWAGAYADLPSAHAAVRVADRAAIAVNGDESATVAPAALVAAIEAAVASAGARARAFARPSGTEDVVRVYAEAATREAADALAAAVAGAVWEHGGGVGERP